MGERWLTRRTWAWASYDVASSVYAGIAPTVLSPLYFKKLLVSSGNPTALWGALAAVAILASGIAALFAALLTSRYSRLTLLKVLTAGLVLAVAALAWNPASTVLWAALAMIAAQSFYFAASTVYESFLPDILPQAFRQKLSGFGWSLGYVGGLAAILVLLWLGTGKAESLPLLKASFAAVALMSVVLFVAVFRLMGRAGFTELGQGHGSARLSGLLGVMSEWRRHGSVFRLLAGTMLVQTGVSAVVTFTAPILANRFGQTLEDLLWLLLIIHFISVPATFGWNYLLTNVPRLAPMTVLLASWPVVLLLLAFGTGGWAPLVTVIAIGCCVGATSSAMRGFLAEIVPEGRSPVFFGLSTLVGRLAAAAGPAIFAVIASLDSERSALLVIFAIALAGAALVILHLTRETAPAA